MILLPWENTCLISCHKVVGGRSSVPLLSRVRVDFMSLAKEESRDES